MYTHIYIYIYIYMYIHVHRRRRAEGPKLAGHRRTAGAARVADHESELSQQILGF